MKWALIVSCYLMLCSLSADEWEIEEYHGHSTNVAEHDSSPSLKELAERIRQRQLQEEQATSKTKASEKSIQQKAAGEDLSEAYPHPKQLRQLKKKQNQPEPEVSTRTSPKKTDLSVDLSEPYPHPKQLTQLKKAQSQPLAEPEVSTLIISDKIDLASDENQVDSVASSINESYEQDEVSCLYTENCCWVKPYAPSILDSLRGRVALHADYLYWRACANSLNGGTVKVASSKNFDAPTNSFSRFFGTESAESNSKLKEISREWESGFKLGLAFQPCCSSWHFGLNWTSFHPTGSTSFNNSKEQIFIVDTLLDELDFNAGTNDASTVFPTITDVHAHWKLRLDLVDFEVSRPVMYCDCFYFRPHMDLRFARIDRNTRIKFEGNQIDPNGQSLAVFCGHNRLSDEFCGVGPRVGCEMRWDAFCGFGIYSDLAFSIIYGEREIDQFEKIERTFSNPQLAAQDVDGEFEADFHTTDDWCSEMITDLGIGAYWHGTICECFDLGVKLGWEHHQVLDTNAYNVGLDGEHLSAQGLTASVGIGF